jgi:uncharacterized membrane protein YhhN
MVIKLLCLALYLTLSVLLTIDSDLDWSGVPRIIVKSFLIPSLSLWVWVNRKPNTSLRLLLILLLGQGFATLGDIFLDLPILYPDGPWLLIGLGWFFVMHMTYIYGYRQLRDFKGVSKYAWIILVVVIGGLIAWLAPKLGMLWIPVTLYSFGLGSMACFASGVSLFLGIAGGAVFFVSDSLVCVRMAGYDFPSRSELVAITYVVAQFVIAHQWLENSNVGGGRAAGDTELFIESRD